MSDRTPNRLIHETSPYLLQHAHNPVDWHPWSDETLAKAKSEDKPILLSIGYSACHWCHVMEHESFEDQDTAELMNRYFINIKVDREERPDLDHIYQVAFQLFHHRGGGWPLTMFLTPELKPFYAGTYFPPTDRYNIPGFPRVLESVAESYRTQQPQIQETTTHISTVLDQLSSRQSSAQPLDADLVRQAVDSLSRLFEPVHGGFGGAPKFPATMVLGLCLRHYHVAQDRAAIEMVTRTLQRMAGGGIYDQIGGGFHRYSVDEQWLVPHFEKMLYDNALLIRLYLDAYLTTRDERYARVARGTVNYLLREMFHPDGGFYSSQDADSEGEEGIFFLWTLDEVIDRLGDDEARLFSKAFDVTGGGNFQHKNILHVQRPVEALAEEFQISPEEVAQRLEQSKARLLACRDRRVKPFRDEKILTSWNGLALSALAEAIKVFNIDAHRTTAIKTADFIWNHLQRDGRLFRTWTAGSAKLNAYLDDYAFVIAAHLDLYEALQDLRYLDRALTLTDSMMSDFLDQHTGDFFFTAHSHDVPMSRPKTAHDQSIPSGMAVAAHCLLRLATYTGRTTWWDTAVRLLANYTTEMKNNPYAMASMLAASDFAIRRPSEIIIAGAANAPGTSHLLRQVHHTYLPNEVICLVPPGSTAAPLAEELINGRVAINGEPTAYVCRNAVCSQPVTSPTALRRLLAER